MITSAWSLTLLGQFELSHVGAVVDRFGSRVDEELLAFLALRSPETVSRSELAAQIWPHLDEATARKQISYHLFQLNKRLSDVGLAKGVVVIRNNLGLDPRVDVDTVGFARHLAQATKQSSTFQQTMHLEHAVAMYGSGLLSKLTVSWLRPIQDRYKRLYDAAVAAIAAPSQRDAQLATITAGLPSTAWRADPPQSPSATEKAVPPTNARLTLVEFVHDAGEGLLTADRPKWLQQIDTRLPEIDEAAVRAIAERRLGEAATLLVPIWRYWQLRGSREGYRHLKSLYDAGYSPIAEERGRFLHAFGILAAFVGDFVAAERCLQTAIEQWQDLDMIEESIRSRGNLGMTYYQRGDFSQALQVYDECFRLSRAIGNLQLQMHVALEAARAALGLGNATVSRSYLTKRTLLETSVDDVTELERARTWALSSAICLLEDDLSRARQEAEDAKRVFTEQNSLPGMALAEQLLGRIAYSLGDLDNAYLHMEIAVTHARAAKSTRDIGTSLSYLAIVVEAQGQPDKAEEIMSDATLLLQSGSDAGALERARKEIAQLKRKGAHEAPPS